MLYLSPWMTATAVSVTHGGHIVLIPIYHFACITCFVAWHILLCICVVCYGRYSKLIKRYIRLPHTQRWGVHKLQVFYRKAFQMHFHLNKVLYFWPQLIENVSWGPIGNQLTLVKMIAGSWTSTGHCLSQWWYIKLKIHVFASLGIDVFWVLRTWGSACQLGYGF